MQLKFDPSTLLDTLPVMLYGLLGGIFVMLLIYCIITVFYRVGTRFKKGTQE